MCVYVCVTSKRIPKNFIFSVLHKIQWQRFLRFCLELSLFRDLPAELGTDVRNRCHTGGTQKSNISFFFFVLEYILVLNM